MRGEMDSFEFDDAMAAIYTEDQAVRDIRTSLWFTYDDLKPHPVSITRPGCEAMRRTIAFVKTDLPLPPSDRRAQWWLNLVFGCVSAACIGAVIFLALTRSPWWLLLPGAAVGVPWMIRSWLHGRGRRDDQPSFYPFQSERQWQQYAPTLVEERIPEYVPALHARPIRTGLISRLALVPGTVLFTLVIAPVLALLLLIPMRRSPGARRGGSREC